MFMNSQVLNREEVQRIHSQSLKILEEVGVHVPSEQVLTMLESAGAEIDWNRQVARIHKSMVEEALAKAPNEFTLGARNPQHDLLLPAAEPCLNMDGCGTHTIDFKTGKRRDSVLQDLADAGKLFDQIPSAKVHWSCVTPADVRQDAAGVLSSITSLINCSKHLQDDVMNTKEVPYIVDMCKAILGSEEEMIARKIFSVTYCTIAPLSHDKKMLEATIALCNYKVPVLIYPMPATGSTGPASLFSNVALANAEALSCFVIFQLASPGTPLIYGSALGRASMKNGAFMEGAVETALMLTAAGQLGQHYGFPTIMAGCLSDSNTPGLQAIMEKTLTALPLVLNNIDVVQGIGLIESSMTLSLEQMLIDEEIFNQCMRMRGGIDVCDEKDFFEDIKAVGPGGHYLNQASTRKTARSREFYYSQLSDGSTYNSWVNLGSPDFFDAAHKKAEQLLAKEPESPLPYQTEKVLRNIMEEAAAKL